MVPWYRLTFVYLQKTQKAGLEIDVDETGANSIKISADDNVNNEETPSSKQDSRESKTSDSSNDKNEQNQEEKLTEVAPDIKTQPIESDPDLPSIIVNTVDEQNKWVELVV